MLHRILACVVCGSACLGFAQEKKPRAWSNEAFYDVILQGIEQQKAWEEKYDKKNIRFLPEMHRHDSAEFLQIPDWYEPTGQAPVTFEVAKAPPIVDFAILQVEPHYLPKPVTQRERPVWGGWGEVERGPDGRFFFSVGNHIAYGADAVIAVYDPAARKQSVMLSSKKLIGWSDTDYGDGKLHGDPTVNADGEMWLLTYNSPDPTPEEVEKTGYRGSFLIHLDTKSGKATNLGIPFDGQTWPHHVWDYQRNLFAASNIVGDAFFAYDTKERRVLFAGFLPPGLGNIYSHSLFVDPDSGNIYASLYTPAWSYTHYNSLEPHYLVKYERKNNRFTKLKCSVPPITPNGGTGAIAAVTDQKDPQGRFWCFSSRGTMFTFDPKTEATQWVGANWDDGRYTYDLCMSPGKRYLYYVPGSDTQAWAYGLPVVQYDITTGKKKVIAFIERFFRKEYGYTAGGTYGLAMDTKGESLFFYVNGCFADSENGRSGYGRPAIFHVQIPASERVE